MHVLNFAVAVAALLVCGLTVVHAEPVERLGVTIQLQVDRSISTKWIANPMKIEAESIWRRYGIDVRWIESEDSDPPAGTLLLPTRVERRRESGLRSWPLVLGRVTLPPDASCLRTIRVSFDATERTLAFRTRARASIARVVRDQDLARALGRVLAHEIGHVLLGPPFHNQAGLMRAWFDPDELGDPDPEPFRLAGADVERLHLRVRELIEEGRREGDRTPETYQDEGAALDAITFTRR